jgi:hypothetical protein
MADTEQTFSPEDQRVLNKTQSIRISIAEKLTKSDPVPGDSDEKRLLVQVLDGIDKQVLMKTKIKTDDQNQKTQQQTATIIAELLLKTNKAIIESPLDNSLKLLSDNYKPDTIVPGQLDTGCVEINPEEILNKE